MKAQLSRSSDSTAPKNQIASWQIVNYQNASLQIANCQIASCQIVNCQIGQIRFLLRNESSFANDSESPMCASLYAPDSGQASARSHGHGSSPISDDRFHRSVPFEWILDSQDRIRIQSSN